MSNQSPTMAFRFFANTFSRPMRQMVPDLLPRSVRKMSLSV
jgi:hypothetical protein